jgi:hypothetical protein
MSVCDRSASSQRPLADSACTYQQSINQSYSICHRRSKCRKVKRICPCLPPHTSDVPQPLDLRMFLPLKTEYRQRLHALQHQMDGALTKKRDFPKLHYEACQLTMTSKAMHKWSVTAGLVPFNPQLVILRDEVKKRPRTPTLEPFTSLFNTPQHLHELPRYIEQ